MSGKRYQSGYDDGFKAGEWAARGDAKTAAARAIAEWAARQAMGVKQQTLAEAVMAAIDAAAKEQV